MEMAKLVEMLGKFQEETGINDYQLLTMLRAYEFIYYKQIMGEK